MAARVARFATLSATRMRSAAALYAPIFTEHGTRVNSTPTRKPREISLATFGSPAPKKRAQIFIEIPKPPKPPKPPKSPRPPRSFQPLKPQGSTTVPVIPPFIEPAYDPILIPPELPFSLVEARNHLIRADSRFATVFAELPCYLYENLEPVDPFQFLVNTMLGSGPYLKFARHRFLRLFDPSLPENIPTTPENPLNYTFPSPSRVANIDPTALKSIGMGDARAGYVLNLATEFVNGRLSTEKLADVSNEVLINIRGVGPVTVDRFAMFGLHHPNVLPTGDLTVQRGLLRWVLSSHAPERYSLRLNPKMLPKVDEFHGEAPPAPGSKQPGEIDINEGILLPAASAPIPLPGGVTVEELQSRVEGKVVRGGVRGGVYLSLEEMVGLTRSWAPYLSLGMYYMWSVVDSK